MSLKRTFSTVGQSSSVTLSESSTSIDKPLPAKLRIKHKTLSQRLMLNIHEAKTSKLRLNHLINFTRDLRLSLLSPDESEIITRFLKDFIKKESEVAIKCKCIELMGEISLTPRANKQQIFEEMCDTLHKEVNHTFVTCVFKTLSLMSVFLSSRSHDNIQKVLKLAVKRLDDSHHDVRCSCLKLISRVCLNEPIKISSGRVIDVLELLSEFSSDQDPRVRATVYQSLLTLHERRHRLDLSIYTKVCSALKDDYENVRLAAVKLIWVFAHIFPENLISSDGEEENTRLLDDAFVKICSMASDPTMKVRAKAIGLLASLHGVSQQLLEQMLDKKLISQGRRVKGFGERQLERFRGGNGASDANPYDMSWKSESNENSNNRTDTFGVIVRALEDEFMEVRTAGVDSLCELANQNPRFACMCTDFLVDMFNDEIESVRLNSINSLIKLHEYVDLREDQLDTVLDSLNDRNQLLRDSVRSLLSKCTMSTRACLNAVVLALLGNMKKYPQDHLSIWSCLKELGAHHPHYVSSLVPDLLVTHAYYAVPEPSVEDPVHIGVLILVFNAAVKSPTVRSLLPDYAQKHHDYLRDSLKDLIPDICKNQSDENKFKERDDEVERFFKKTITRINALSAKISSEQMTFCMRDLEHVRDMHQSANATTAEFLLMYLKCRMIIKQCMNDRSTLMPSCLSASNSTAICNNVKEILKMSYRLEFLFSGQGLENLIAVRSVRIFSHCLNILWEFRQESTDGFDRSKLLRWQKVLQRLKTFTLFLSNIETENIVYKTIEKLEGCIEEHLLEPHILKDILQEFILSFDFSIVLDNLLRKSTAKMIQPVPNPENPIRFCAGLTSVVHVDAWLENVSNISNIFIKVCYPDCSIQIYQPKVTDFVSTTSSKHRLVTDVYITHRPWTHPSFVKINIVLSHPFDINEELYSFADTMRVNSAGSIDADANGRGYIDLCSAVQISIHPKTSNHR